MTIPASQAETAAFLQRITGASPAETHISAVFAGPSDVYKLKKSVRLSFLDFSSLETRRQMAQRELDLNRPNAPEIYRAVLAIVRTPDGTLNLAPDTEPQALDYVVHMARIPADDFLDVLIARNGTTPALLDALADAIAALHAKAPPKQGWDNAANMRAITTGNATAARNAGLPPDAIDTWERAALAELDAITPHLRARAASGAVRRAHGDLHLGNLCLWHGIPTAFDALEFDESLATIDVGYDLAFLLMDLEFHAGRPAANRVLNRYLARTGDFNLLPGLPLYLSNRAMIRAHVQAARGEPAQAATYLQTAHEMLHPPPPIAVAIGGLQGTGKSTLARALAPTLGRAPGAVIVRSDEIRKRLHNAAPEQKLPPEAYTPSANARVNEALITELTTALRAGQSTVADCTFLHPPLRHAAESAARDTHTPFLGIWLQADLQTLRHRVAHRTNDASDAGPEILRQSAQTDPGHLTWRRINATDTTAALTEIQQALAELPVHPRSAPPQAEPQISTGPRSTPHGHPDDHP